ncbi:membrane progestin receptor delta-like [Amphibalanus amphitrite]|uniref:membrane progestin receptor delta-like n=1 Tax=Amphibalanus amphitrite TaxID=1232801 RepID=UPI001C9065E4|nr:membrane progestin receptor delta-like [Amphibalanus amphitrite]
MESAPNMESAPTTGEPQRWTTESASELDTAARRRSHRRLALPHWLLAVTDDKWTVQPTVRLLSDTEVEPMRREPYITGGYLPSGSFALCLRALLLPTNELFNSWSALLPALGYLWQLLRSVPPQNGADPRPYHLLLLSVALSSLASFLAHGFSAVSPAVAQLFYGLDYAGITLLGLAMTMAEHAYGSGGGEERWLDGVLLPTAAVLALLGCAAACWSRLSRCQHRGQRLRLRGQAVLFLWSAAAGSWSPLRAAAALCAASAVCVYASRWPERRWPGRWDVLGHSHGTFHVLTQLAAGCCVAAVRAQLEAAPAGQQPVELRWWVEVGYGAVASALVATAIGFTGLYAAAERHTKRPGTDPRPATASGPQGGDPEVRPPTSDISAAQT